MRPVPTLDFVPPVGRVKGNQESHNSGLRSTGCNMAHQGINSFSSLANNHHRFNNNSVQFVMNSCHEEFRIEEDQNRTGIEAAGIGIERK
eukprot:gene25925-biopygen11847